MTYLCEYLHTSLITPDMVIETLKELKPDKSPGPDGWHPMFLKSIADLIAYPLSVLYQKSLNESLVPSQWLQAMVTAIHKTRPKNSYENYRPISITSIIGKLMESIIRDKIVSHMERNNLFSETQHGFVPSRNCITNLLICVEHWTNILDKGYPVDIIYTDFSKAFDKVPHQRLLKKMENLGIAGNTLQWIKSFLSDRKQRVRVENEFSSWTSVKSGIPQGSVLGPILFVMFINDMLDIVKSMCLLFADDAKIFRSVHHSSDYTELQEDLNELTKRSTRWQLPFNIDKCKSLHMGKNNKKLTYEMDGKKLKQVKEEKDLGVLVDDELKFHKQTSSAIKKANGVLGMMKKSFSAFDDTNLPILYKTLVRPHLEYGNVVWGPHYKEDIKAIEKIQRRATKMVPHLKNMSYQERLRQLKIPSLAQRRRR